MQLGRCSATVEGTFLSIFDFDLLVIDSKGVSVMHLGTMDKKFLTDSKGREHMLHSLEAYTFLKVDPGNYLKFDCTDEDK